MEDVLSGFFLLRREVIESISLNSFGYKILPEILLKGNYEKVVEVPYEFSGRVGGKSKQGIGDHLEFLRYLIYLNDILESNNKM